MLILITDHGHHNNPHRPGDRGAEVSIGGETLYEVDLAAQYLRALSKEIATADLEIEVRELPIGAMSYPERHTYAAELASARPGATIVYLSAHLNSARPGTDSLYFYRADKPRAGRLGSAIADRVGAELGLPVGVRGIGPGDYTDPDDAWKANVLAVIPPAAGLVALLLEPLNIQDPRDHPLLNSAGLSALGSAIAEGVLEWWRGEMTIEALLDDEDVHDDDTAGSGAPLPDPTDPPLRVGFDPELPRRSLTGVAAAHPPRVSLGGSSPAPAATPTSPATQPQKKEALMARLFKRPDGARLQQLRELAQLRQVVGLFPDTKAAIAEAVADHDITAEEAELIGGEMFSEAVEALPSFGWIPEDRRSAVAAAFGRALGLTAWAVLDRAA